MSIQSTGRRLAGLALASLAALPAAAQLGAGDSVLLGSAGDALSGVESGPFRRVASFQVFRNSSIDQDNVCEIVASAGGGQLLVYTDSANEALGFVDIAIPAAPQPAGLLPLAGEPTSVAVKGRYALACINTSADFVDTSGELVVVDLLTRTVARSLPLGGQPDAIAISPDGRYAAICIENERDEDLGDGEPPQLPAGFLVIADIASTDVADWSTRVVDLVGVPDLFPSDPEPEFVDINAGNLAVVTMQENNHIAVVDLTNGLIVRDFSAGSVDLDLIDTNENDLIEQDASLTDVPREPDAVAWTSLVTFATADEGDLFGGSRGFTTWSARRGATLFEAGNSVEHTVARHGHYPESRSENKGSEPEGVEFGQYGDDSFLFVGSERGSVVLVYELLGDGFAGAAAPVLRQVLPSGLGPEGLLAIPERDLFVVASEEDSRADGFRATLSIFARVGSSNYPDVVSADRPGTGVPIPWAALSGLASGPFSTLAVHDSYYRASRIFALDTSAVPAVITEERVLRDDLGLLAGELAALKAALPGSDDFDPAALVNDDGTVNLDPEGISFGGKGTTWVASEGAGNLVDGVSDPDDRPFESPNLLLEVAADGTIVRVVSLPVELVADQLRFGFEGVALDGDALYVAFQRAWGAAGDPSDRARIGRYDLGTSEWTFAYYPLETPASANGGWVGLSELTALGGGRFAAIERDNQAGADAAIKLITSFSIDGVSFLPAADVASFETLTKSVELDVLAAGLYVDQGGSVPEKLEGFSVLPDGTALLVNDNDGVDDNSGETRLLRITGLFED